MTKHSLKRKVSRLGSLSKNDVPCSKREKEDPVIVKPVETVDCEGTQLVQRCVIIQRDEKGYGLTVSGDNPVFVQSVKDDGAAARAGVQRGDRIIKVNGTLVTQSNHVEVVHLIKSGSYVALTLLSRPSGYRSHGSGGAPNSSPPGHHPSSQLQYHHSQSQHHSYSNQHGNMNAANRSSITGPIPVDEGMQLQVAAARIRTMQQMLEQEREYVEKQKSEYAKNPSEKIKSELNTANQRIRQIEETLSSALSQSNFFWTPKSPQNTRSYTQDPPPPPPPPRRHTSSIPHQISLPATALPPVPPMRVESKQQALPANNIGEQDSNSPASANQYPLSHSMDNIQKINAWIPIGPTHSRQRSSPDAILHLNESIRHHPSPDLSRSHSDVASSRKLNSSDSNCSDKNMKRSKTAENNTSRASSFGAYDSTSTDSPRITPPGTPPPPYSNFERIENAEGIEGGDATANDESPISPMGRSPCSGDIDEMKMECSDNQLHLVSEMSPLEGTPPTGKNMAGLGMPFINQHPIISMEEEDPLSDSELNHAHMSDHGPYKKWTKLCKHHCHLSIFIRYLISNSDPSSTFFYLISVLYEEGTVKEMKKWAYEIHSSFLMPGAPLKVNKIDENILRGIDDVLQNHVDREDKLKKIFSPARKKAVYEINEFLADFRNKRQMGLAGLFGPQDCHLEEAIHDASKSARIIEGTLIPLLESFPEDADTTNDKESATASALATLLSKHFGIKSQHAITVYERYPQFLSKDTKSKGIKFLKGSKKAVFFQGHHFNPQHYFTVTYCNHCQLIIWGIGNQGYQCQYCDMNVHKPCVRIVEETCIGARSANKKDKKKDRVAGIVENFIGKSRKPSPNNPSSAGDRVRRLPDDITELGSPILGVVEIQSDASLGEKVVPSGRVDKLRKTFESVNENDDKGVSSNGQPAIQSNSGAASGPPDGTGPLESSKKGTSVVRSESLRTRREAKHSFRKRSDPNIPRSNSDVDGDERAITALNQSGSSSNSSLSTKSLDSPSNSLEAVHKPISNEISPLTSTSPSAIVQHSPSSCSGQRRDENDDSDFDVDPNPPNWADSVNWDIVRHLKPKEKKRQDVINELIHTERTHVRNLKVLERVFFRPMQAEQVLPQDQIKLLFANLEEMIQIHNRLNMKLKDKRKEDPIVGDIGEILVEMFDGASGEKFREAAATFCKNQSIALESLKVRQRKEQKLAQFLTDASSNPLCRRFQLKDIIPTGMQRLTKYPLLLENLAKYTCQSLCTVAKCDPHFVAQFEAADKCDHVCKKSNMLGLLKPKLRPLTAATTTEYTNLMRVLDCSKDILNFVNQAVKDAENKNRLEQFQKKIDRGQFDKFDHVVSLEYKNLDLTKCRMIHEGALQWRLNRQKVVDLHVLLLEDILVLLQKQDEKYVLKYHNTSVGSGREETKLTHSPIIKVQNLLSRNVATDKRAFFLVSTSHQVGPQIYELVALSSADRKTWLRHITEAAESYKTKEAKNKRIEHIPNAPEQRESAEDSTEDGLKSRDSLENQESQDTAEGGEISDVGEAPEISERPDMTVLTSPDSKPGAECRISTGTTSEGEDGDDSAASAASASATSQGTPTSLPGIGTSPSIPRRFQRVEILQIAEGPPLIEPSEVVVSEGAVLQTAEPVLAPIEKLRRKDQLIKEALNEKQDLVADILHIPREEIGQLNDFTSSVEEDKDAKELVVAAMAQVTRLAEVINQSLTVTEEDAISAGSDAPSSDLTIPPSVSPGSTSPRVPSPKPGRKACRMPSAPVNILLSINSALSVHMTQLLALVTEREEERERLRKEVRASREQIHKLHDARRRTPQSQSPSHSRPNSFISMSSSTSEPCDITERLHGEDDMAIPSTLEAYNKLVYHQPFASGGLSNISDDHPADVIGEDLRMEMFVDAPSESCTDAAESSCHSDEDDDAKAQCDETETLLQALAVEQPVQNAAPMELVTEEQPDKCGDSGKDPPPQMNLDSTGTSEYGAVF